MNDAARSRAPADAPKSPAPPAALARFLAEAGAAEAGEIHPLRADPRVVQHNVGLGVSAVLAWADHIRDHLPHVDLEELRSLPDLALCLTHAADEAAGGATEAAAARELLLEAHALRRVLLAAAQALVEVGAIPGREMSKIGGTNGAVDAGADCAALAALFEKRGAEIAGLHPVGAEEIARAAEIGAALKAAWKPRAGARKPGAHGVSPVEARDRLWTLLLSRHERLWAVGAYIYGQSVSAHVPPIAVSAARPKKAAKGGEA